MDVIVGSGCVLGKVEMLGSKYRHVGSFVGLPAILLIVLLGCDIVITPPVDEYVLVVTVEGGGEVINSPSGSTYSCDSVVQLKAVADEGWTFSHWQGDVCSSNPEISIVMDYDKSVTAVFEEEVEDLVELEVEPVGNGDVILTPEGEPGEVGYMYERGSSVTLKAVAECDWCFIGWFTADGSVYSTSSQMVLQLDDDKTTVIAKFSPEVSPAPYDLTDAEIYAQDDDHQYLGWVSTDPFACDSLANPFGYYGDEYSSLSIWNCDGFYGSDYGNYTPYDPDAAYPPEIYLHGNLIGYLTLNPDFSPRYDPDDLAEAIGRYDVIRY
jgi:hypothetical protein